MERSQKISRNQGSDQNGQNSPDIRFISAIDCKPVDPPFLKLMTFDEFVEKNTESKEVKPDNNKKSKRHHKTNLSIERTEYDDSIRKKGIYRILDDKLACYITECQVEAEQIKKQKEQTAKKLSMVKALGRKNTVKVAMDDTDEDEVTMQKTSPEPRTTDLEKAAAKAQENVLGRQQEILLKKLIAFDSIEMADENANIKRRLYNLFFVWRAQGTQNVDLNDDDDDENPGRLTNDDKLQKEREEKIER